MQLERDWVEDLVFGKESARRFTQDSPVLPDVWIAFAEAEDNPVELLLTPSRDVRAGDLARFLDDRIRLEQKTASWKVLHPGRPKRPFISYNQATVFCELFFDELIRVVLPLTSWWHDILRIRDTQALAQDLEDLKSLPDLGKALSGDPAARAASGWSMELLWMVRTVGIIAQARSITQKDIDEDALWRAISDNHDGVVQEVVRLVRDLVPVPLQRRSLVSTISMNRQAEAGIFRSVPAVKADAATQLFNIRCSDLTWAVLDSGIDARHPAFRKRDANQQLVDPPFAREDLGGLPVWHNNTRILATYDFAMIRYVLRANADVQTMPEDSVPPRLHGRLKELKARLKSDPIKAKDLRRSLNSGREVDWGLLAPFLEIPHREPLPGPAGAAALMDSALPSDSAPPREAPAAEAPVAYTPPIFEHGTHVAGILAGDWRSTDGGGQNPAPSESLKGVGGDLNLYDLRVLDDSGLGDEFTVMAALQFVRYLNSHKDRMLIHGVNLSLSIPHDVANYACGRTPVCEECERLVGAGIVVVVAAGNRGYMRFLTKRGTEEEGYRSISITDPGNTEGVITVGATHRYMPHTYGVSYFSSRGPTGDGRLKPDIVAPGEKIEAPVPGGEYRTMDGTSMAAPHVSGAAALLMARHRELIGEPERVKHILCETATDLGRERYFQGHGMLDILRALQSV